MSHVVVISVQTPRPEALNSAIMWAVKESLATSTPQFVCEGTGSGYVVLSQEEMVEKRTMRARIVVRGWDTKWIG